MALVEIANAAEDPGTWFTWKKDPETEKPIRALIRRITTVEDRRLFKERLGSRKVGQGETQASFFDRRVILVRARAALGLIKFDGLAIRPASAEVAAAYAEMLGRPAAAGVDIDFSDVVLSEPLKAHLLDAVPFLATWVSERIDELMGLKAEEDAEDSKT